MGKPVAGPDKLLDEKPRPVERGPGDEFFPGLRADEELFSPQLAALREMRAMMAEVRPAFAPPEATSAEHSDWYELSLVIRHSQNPECTLDLHFGDGYLVASWPGFDGGFGGWDWEPELSKMFCALLTGRNRQVLRYRLGRRVETTTEMWDAGGAWRRTETWFPLRWRFLQLLPIGGQLHERSISFERPEPLAT